MTGALECLVKTCKVQFLASTRDLRVSAEKCTITRFVDARSALLAAYGASMTFIRSLVIADASELLYSLDVLYSARVSGVRGSLVVFAENPTKRFVKAVVSLDLPYAEVKSVADDFEAVSKLFEVSEAAETPIVVGVWGFGELSECVAVERPYRVPSFNKNWHGGQRWVADAFIMREDYLRSRKIGDKVLEALLKDKAFTRIEGSGDRPVVVCYGKFCPEQGKVYRLIVLNPRPKDVLENVRSSADNVEVVDPYGVLGVVESTVQSQYEDKVCYGCPALYVAYSIAKWCRESSDVNIVVSDETLIYKHAKTVKDYFKPNYMVKSVGFEIEKFSDAVDVLVGESTALQTALGIVLAGYRDGRVAVVVEDRHAIRGLPEIAKLASLGATVIILERSGLAESVRKLLTALGVEVKVPKFSEPYEALAAIRSVLEEGGVVLIERAYKSLEGKAKVEVDASKCDRCGDCMLVPCKALSVSEEGIPRVDTSKCSGCGLCAAVCTRGAIQYVR